MTRDFAIIALVACVIGVSPSVAAGPNAKVRPNMHLANGQSVTVSARGFAPNQPVFIAECNMNLAADGEAACDLSTYLTVTTTVKGRVPPTPFTVLTGAIGNGTCGTSKADRNCYIAVTNEALTSFANVQIVFAAP